MYTINYKNSANKQLESLPTKIALAILEKIDQLETNPYPNGYKKIKGFTDYYRIRVGSYRVIYEVQNHELIIMVIKIGHRKDVYS